MTPITYLNAHDAIRWGNAKASATGVPVGIAYHKREGWRLYVLTEGCALAGEPEFLCFGSGSMPLPLSPSAKTIIRQMLAQGSAA